MTGTVEHTAYRVTRVFLSGLTGTHLYEGPQCGETATANFVGLCGHKDLQYVTLTRIDRDASHVSTYTPMGSWTVWEPTDGDG